MAISVADNFSYQGTKPLDARVSFDTVAAMASAVDATLYDGCLSYVKATKKYYSYDSTNEVDPTTGKWREYSSGGGGESHGIPSGGTTGQALVKSSNDDYDAIWSDIEAAQGSAHLEKTPIAVTITGDSGTSSGLLITFPNDDAIDNYDLICFEVSAGGGRQHVFADIPTLYQYPEGITFIMSGYNSPGLISTSGLFPYRVTGSLQVVDSSPDVIKMTASYNDNNFKASVSSVIGYKVKGGTTEPNIGNKYDVNIKMKVKLKSNTWTTKTWNGLTDFDGSQIWTDGENIYYSQGTSQYVLNKSTNTWTTKTWNGLTNFDGYYIWTDGENIYYSKDNSQYVLNKSTNTWTTKNWNGLTSFNGIQIWTDGENIYRSNTSKQYVLNKSTNTWTTKTWNGLTNFNGGYTWTDGENIYYSQGTSQYVLNKSTNTWTTKTWNGLTNFDGYYIWTDGENIYYSQGTSQYVLNKSTNTWTTKTWNGLTDFSGSQIWTDGENIYYSFSSNCLVLSLISIKL